MYFKRLLKQIQYLPERNSDAATYLLLGQIPITEEIHKRALTTFGNIIRDFGTVECELAHRQLAVKSKKSHGWFILVSEILEQYALSLSHDLLLNPPGKLSWKNTVYRAVNQCWENKLKEEEYTKSTLKYLNIDNMEIRKAHMVWEAAGCETVSVSKAILK
jgi:hypothetical protein